MESPPDLTGLLIFIYFIVGLALGVSYSQHAKWLVDLNDGGALPVVVTIFIMFLWPVLLTFEILRRYFNKLMEKYL